MLNLSNLLIKPLMEHYVSFETLKDVKAMERVQCREVQVQGETRETVIALLRMMMMIR